MTVAERLFAEHGLCAVSNRQIGEAAGQRNVTAVSYHFGSRTELVRAITTRHGERSDRMAAQVMTDPAMRALVSEEALNRPHLRRTLDGLGGLLGHLPPGTRAARGEMARHLITHACAEQEQALAEGTGLPRPSWQRTAGDLTDAVVGLMTAPVTSRRM
nr:helix-turn-helix domain-containing protein [Streptomyces alanosinicus]